VRLPILDADGLRERDLELARHISAAARELGVPADPAAVQTVQLTIDALVGPAVRPFWRAVLAYQEVGDEDLVDPQGRGPSIWFHGPRLSDAHGLTGRSRRPSRRWSSRIGRSRCGRHRGLEARRRA
jgi:hypothetical protein